MASILKREKSYSLLFWKTFAYVRNLGAKKTTSNCGAKRTRKSGHAPEEPSLAIVLAGYINYFIIFLVSWLRELFLGPGPVRGDMSRFKERNVTGYTPLYSSFESFYVRNVYRRLKDVFGQPIASVPGATVTVVDRVSDNDFWSFKMSESRKKNCINLGSYNYLGFAECNGPCNDQAIAAAKSLGLSSCSSAAEVGVLRIHKELEATVAEFLGTEDAFALGMGFATNSLNLPSLLSKGCLAISDELNHSSIILGLRLSGATVMVFKHNNMEHLERVLREAIVRGRPRTHRPWKKILIVVEGVYSMEGTIIPLPEVVALKKKYGAYLYLDEAHSVGAMGPRGRGVVDYYNINPHDVDILMGTFTKSFGSAGGYIAGSKQLISHLRRHSPAFYYAATISPAVAMQIIASMKLIMHGDGIERVSRLARNSKYFRERLVEMGFVVYGHEDSPVVPLMLFMPSKIRAFVRESLRHGLATVGVGFPGTAMTKERARFCISAGHTQEMIDKALEIISVVGDTIHVKYKAARKSSEADVQF